MALGNFQWLAPGARAHITVFLRNLAPAAGALVEQLEGLLRRRGFHAVQRAALRAVTPAAAARCRSLDAFLRRVEAAAPSLAALGLAPDRAALVLGEFERLLARTFQTRFQPAREQLQSAILFTLYRAFYELRQREVRRLEAAARRAEEQERRRIGRELHDEAGQSLLLLRLQLEMLERTAPASLATQLAEARLGVESIIGELRRIVAALSPAVLERLGLEAAIHHLAARFHQEGKIGIRLRISPQAGGLPMETQEVVYRVAQEALQNVAKHASARTVNLSLGAADKSVRLRISDNGVGFDTELASRQAMCFGLAGMRQRAELLGGRLMVQSAPGKGTAIMLELPVPAVAGLRSTERGRRRAKV